MLIIGLTGGVGSGKSTVAKMFQELGIDIIDTDVIAREVTTPESKSLVAIQSHFGRTILNSDNSLNRSALRNEIFNHPEKKEWLENLLHPVILDEAKKQTLKVSSPYCILIIPLLFETQNLNLIDRILVVDTSKELQIERTMKRDGCSRDLVLKMIASQIPRQTRLKGANDIILNNDYFRQLQSQVLRLHEKLLKIADEKLKEKSEQKSK